MALRVLHIVDTLSLETGGPPEVVRMLARSYLKAGVSVEVVCLDNPDAPFLRDFPCTVQISPAPSMRSANPTWADMHSRRGCGDGSLPMPAATMRSS